MSLLRRFYEQILGNLSRRKKSKNSKDAEALRINLVQSKLSDANIIRILSSDDTMASRNLDNFQKLTEKHPAPNKSIEVTNENAQDIQQKQKQKLGNPFLASLQGARVGWN